MASPKIQQKERSRHSDGNISTYYVEVLKDRNWNVINIYLSTSNFSNHNVISNCISTSNLSYYNLCLVHSNNSERIM